MTCKDNHGYALQLVVLTIAIVLVMVSMVSVLVISESKSFDRAKRTEQAYALAKEGVKVAFARLEDNDDNTSPTFTAGPAGKQYTVSYNATTKVINSTGTIGTNYGDIIKSISVKVIESPLSYNFTETFSTDTKKDAGKTNANWNKVAGNLKTKTALDEVIYIADYPYGIRKYSLSGTYLQGWELAIGAKHLTVDENNDVWVVGSLAGNNYRVYKYNSSGVPYWPDPFYIYPEVPWQTHGGITTEDGYVYLPHAPARKTWKHDLNFNLVQEYYHTEKYGPYVNVVKNGFLYSAKWESSKWVVRRQSTNPLGYPSKLTPDVNIGKISDMDMDSSNNIYVADWKYVEMAVGSCYIRKFNSSMVQLDSYGGACGSGAGAWKKGATGGIARASNGQIFTADWNGSVSRLQRFDAALNYTGSWARSGARYYDIAIGNDLAITGKVAQSKEVDSITTTIKKATLNAVHTLYGKTITYRLSANGGANWQIVTPGTEINFTNPGNNLKWKATLNTTDPNISPLIDEISIDYNAGSNYKMDYSTWRTD